MTTFATYDPSVLTGTIQHSIADPYGGSAVSNTIAPVQQYGIHNLPPRLRGMEIDRCLKTVNYEISDALRVQTRSESEFKDMVKRKISHMLVEDVYEATTFTQVADPTTFNTKVIGRVVVMSVDQLNKLIQAAR